MVKSGVWLEDLSNIGERRRRIWNKVVNILMKHVCLGMAIHEMSDAEMECLNQYGKLVFKHVQSNLKNRQDIKKIRISNISSNMKHEKCKLLVFKEISLLAHYTLCESCPYSAFFGSVFSPNARKYGPEKLRIWAFFTQWYYIIETSFSLNITQS